MPPRQIILRIRKLKNSTKFLFFLNILPHSLTPNPIEKWNYLLMCGSTTTSFEKFLIWDNFQNKWTDCSFVSEFHYVTFIRKRCTFQKRSTVIRVFHIILDGIIFGCYLKQKWYFWLMVQSFAVEDKQITSTDFSWFNPTNTSFDSLFWMFKFVAAWL